MIDIFKQPKLYIADIEIKYKRTSTPPRKGRHNKKIMVYEKAIELKLVLEKQPVLLLDGELPSKRYKEEFLKRFENRYQGKFEELTFDIKIIKSTFSSNINYPFNLLD